MERAPAPSAESGKAGQSPTEPAKAATSAVVGLDPELARHPAQRSPEHLAVAHVRAGLGRGLVGGIDLEHLVVVRLDAARREDRPQPARIPASQSISVP